ncbi:MAG: DotU family type IV/VI secretion system protein [Pirellulales bacterium]|nr:DotU family type IV/VI secretion system protein [Pirellulales bacterium]
MRPEFAKAVDPVIERTLSLLERLELGEEADPQVERSRLKDLLSHAEALIGQNEEWKLAKYALACWIDEVLINAQWSGRASWENFPLEVELFGTQEAYDRYFLRAQEASNFPNRDALEVYYVCFVLGFRGLYRTPGEAERRQMPATPEAWANQTARSLREVALPSMAAGTGQGAGAPPLYGKRHFIGGSLLLTVLLALAASLGAWYVFRLQSQDALGGTETEVQGQSGASLDRSRGDAQDDDLLGDEQGADDLDLP